jgi:hypothetical protein
MKKNIAPSKPVTTTVRTLDKKDLAPITGGGGGNWAGRGIIIEG